MAEPTLSRGARAILQGALEHARAPMSAQISALIADALDEEWEFARRGLRPVSTTTLMRLRSVA